MQRQLLLRVAVLAGIGAATAAASHERPQQGADPATSAPYSVFVSVADRRHAPINDLGPPDFIIKEDGRERAVLSVARATQQMQVVVLVDDNGSGIFRYGLTGLAELLQGRAELALRTVTNQVQTIVDFTTSASAWMAGITRVGVRPPTPEGGQLIEGIFTAARDFKKREAKRPVIVALTVGGDEQSPHLSNDVLDELWKSRAALHVVFAETIARPSRPVTRASDLLEGNFNLSKVIGDGPKESGGRRRDVLTTGMMQTEVQQVGVELLSQYEIVYARPTSGNAPRRLQVSVRRNDAEVTAPTRAPVAPGRR